MTKDIDLNDMTTDKKNDTRISGRTRIEDQARIQSGIGRSCSNRDDENSKRQ